MKDEALDERAVFRLLPSAFRLSAGAALEKRTRGTAEFWQERRGVVEATPCSIPQFHGLATG